MAEITKALATIEDLALGFDSVTQTRGGVEVNRKEINAGNLGGLIVIGKQTAVLAQQQILDLGTNVQRLVGSKAYYPCLWVLYRECDQCDIVQSTLIWDEELPKSAATPQSGDNLSGYIDPSVDNANQGNGVGNGVWVVW